MDFCSALTTAYREQPCQVLPNALWKTRSVLDEMEVSLRQEDEQILELTAWREKQLHVCWTASGEHPESITRSFLSEMDFLLLHQWHAGQVSLGSYITRSPYFRLRHDLSDLLPPSLPVDFAFSSAEPDRQAEQIARFLNQCYASTSFEEKHIQGWIDHPVYDPTLWLWIMDKKHDAPAALGIGEFDASICEGSLEWIQVHQDYRRCGLGKALVLELLQRLQDKASFVTVSGKLEDPSQPERLYRRCGFDGEDIWWLLKR